jgi:uncharacterized protein YecT (DUF1311 family)
VIFAVAVAGAALSAPLASAASGPPVIKEPFTPLPCPAHPKTTLQQEGCAEKAVLKTGAAINARAKKIYYKLKAGSPRTSFVNGEKAWLSYRRASCKAQASVYAGGSFQPVAYLRCEANRNKTHLGDLAELLRAVS